MPLQVIMTAAKTVSRASEDVLSPPLIISVTISATSMMVTATASTSEPNGSPTRAATTSAWCTAASTAPARNAATSTTAKVGRSRPHARTSATTASSGTTTVQLVRCPRVAAMRQRCQIGRATSRQGGCFG